MLTATVEKGQTSTTLRAIGDVDMHTAPTLADALETSCALTRPGERLVLDLTGVRFFSGAGLQLLLKAWQQSRELHVSLLVIAPGSVRRLLHVADLDDLFETVPADTSSELTPR